MVQDPLETAADSSNGSSGTSAHVTAQVVVNTTHTGQHTLIDSDVASTSTGTIVSGSPHYITVTGELSKPHSSKNRTWPQMRYTIIMLR